LTEVAHEAGERGRVHDPPTLALHLEHARRRLRDQERPAQVHIEHQVEVLLAHVEERLVAQDPGVVHHDVEPAELVQRAPDEPVSPFARGHAVVVRYGVSALALDLGDHLVRHLRTLAAAVAIAAEIVHHDLGALAGEEQRVLAADAAARPGDDRDLALEQTHADLLLGRGASSTSEVPERRGCRAPHEHRMTNAWHRMWPGVAYGARTGEIGRRRTYQAVLRKTHGIEIEVGCRGVYCRRRGPFV